MMGGSSSSTFLNFNPQRSQKSIKKQLYAVLENCLERFECHKDNEYHFASPEFVEGIPPFACEFACQPCNNNLLAAADEDGRVVICDTDSTQQNSVVKEWSAHKNAIFDIAWSSHDPRLLTASGDQSAALWDIQTATCLATFKQHRCSLKSVSFRPCDGHVFATGARDGSIMLWDDRSKKKNKGLSQLPVSVISEAHVNPLRKTQPKRRKKLASDLPAIDSSNSVSVVLFQKEDKLLSAGAADGIVKLWDLRMLKTAKGSGCRPFHQFPYAGTSHRRRGFSSLALSSTRTQLFASCTDSTIYGYDLSGVLGSRPISHYHGHVNSTFFVRATVSPDDLFLLSGSSDNRAYIWKIGQPESPPVTLVGHEAEVTAVAWSPQDFTKVVTCSDDNTMRIWKMSSDQTRSDDGQTSIIGKAERCKREAPLDSQGNSEQMTSSSSQQSSQSSISISSLGTSDASTFSGKTGGSSSSHHSPVPSSTKKRKFSLRDWVTTSPSPSRHPSPGSPSKRTRSASTPRSSELGVSGKEMTVGAGRKRNCDSAVMSVDARKKAKVSTEESSQHVELASNAVVSMREEAITKERCQNVKELDTSKLKHDSASKTGINTGDQKDVGFENEPDKENTVTGKKTVSPLKKSASQTKAFSLESQKSTPPLKKVPPGQRSPLKDDIPMNRASPLVTQLNQITSKSSQNTSKPAKKNLASYFPKSSKPTPSGEQCPTTAEEKAKDTKEQNLDHGLRDAEDNQRNEGKSLKDKAVKQQSPGKCVKDKRVAKLHKAVKRRNSAGTIEGYFSPLVKRHKSES